MEEQILADRQSYQAAYSLIEEFISARGDILGGSWGVSLLLGQERIADDFQYEIFSARALPHSVSLANILAARYEICFHKTAVAKQTFLIFVETRRLVTYHQIPSAVRPLLYPLTCTWEKRNLLVLSPEVILLDLYRTLYSPQLVEEWPRALRNENLLFRHLRERQKILGGAGKAPKSYWQNLLLQKFLLNNEKVILVGEFALKLILGGERQNGALQVITQGPWEGPLKKLLPQATFHTRDLHIMKDFRLQRTTVRLQQDLLYLYHSGDYDLLPFTRLMHGKKFLQVGGPFVLLRFLLIDMWSLRQIRAREQISEDFLKLRVKQIFSRLLELRRQLSGLQDFDILTTVSPENSALQVFPPESARYFGTYEDDLVFQKNLLKSAEKKYPDYFPNEHLARLGTYREITSSDS